MNSKKSLAYYLPVISMIAANVLYTVTAKITPSDVDPYASVSLTYLICIAYAFIMFFVTAKGESYPKALKKANWTAPALGACLVALEVSTIMLFRVGWDLSVSSLLVYVLTAVALIFVGAFFYKEKISATRAAGIAACIIGIVCVSL